MEDLKNPSLFQTDSFIKGQWLTSENKFNLYNPGNESLICHLSEVTEAQIELAIASAKKAQNAWQKKTPFERAELMHKWAALIDENKDDLALIMSREQGKPIYDALGEVIYGNTFITWFAEEGKRVYGDVMTSPLPNKHIQVIKQPVGVVAAITPWNFPNAMITRKAAAALGAGCSFIVKPAAETPLSALALAYLAQQAGLPDGLINVVVGENAPAIGNLLTTHPDISKFTFTGSTRVGKILTAQCASTVKKVTMELGGNAPFIVFDDGDIDLAVNALANAKIRNNGQVCTCPNRIYLHEAIADEFARKLVDKLSTVKQGYGEDEGVEIGSLIHNTAAQNVHRLVDIARQEGADILLGGLTEPPKNSVYPLTVLSGVSHGDSITREEIFGPAFPLITFSDEQEVIKCANDVEYGLASYFYTNNIHRVYRVAEQLDFGMIGINDTLISNAVAPFGGIKESGYGKEGSKYGLDDYLVVKALTLGIQQN